MKEKEDKLRLMKQILVDNNDIPVIALKEQTTESTTKVISPNRDRVSRKVTSSVNYILFLYF
jgi:hypothetical protein